MNTSKYISLTVMTAAVALAASAEDLKTEIKVDRTVVPTERAAMRISTVTPDLIAPTITKKSLSLTEYNSTSQLTSTFDILSPASYPATSPLSTQRGYAAVGYFPNFNLGASAGYSFIQNDRTRLGAWMQYDGNLYHGRDINNDRRVFKNSTFTVGADVNQKVGDNSQLAVDVDYTTAAIHGVQYDNDQHINFGGLCAKWWSKAGSVGYHIDADIDAFGFARGYKSQVFAGGSYYDTPKSGEVVYSLKVGAVGHLSHQTWLGVELSGAVQHFTNGNTLSYNAEKAGNSFYINKLTSRNLGLFNVMPHYGFHVDNVTARIGVNVDLPTGGSNKSIHLAPRVLFDWNPASQFALWARVQGGDQLNTLRSLYDVTYFLPSSWVYDRSFVPVTADLGINVGPVKGASLELRGGYAKANDWLMPAHNAWAISKIGHVADITAFEPVDIRGWHVGATLNYAYRDIVKMHVSYDAAPQSYDKGYYLWRDRAKYVVGAGVEVSPIKPLNITLDYEYRAKRQSYTTTVKTTEAVSLGNINNLNLGASYKFNETVSAFANAENLFCHRYDILYGVPSQGIKGLVGVTVKF
jgi:hypothetical protein